MGQERERDRWEGGGGGGGGGGGKHMNVTGVHGRNPPVHHPTLP